MPRLFHVSEYGDIARFEPQPAPNNPDAQGNVVWAIDEEHLPNYLLPRDCPRVCFIESGRRVVAIEWRWLECMQSTHLYVYEFNDSSFQLLDSIAGYWVSTQPVVPRSKRIVTDLLLELEGLSVELRVVDDLWGLHDYVKDTTTEFSMIRMKNAQPPL